MIFSGGGSRRAAHVRRSILATHKALKDPAAPPFSLPSCRAGSAGVPQFRDRRTGQSNGGKRSCRKRSICAARDHAARDQYVPQEILPQEINMCRKRSCRKRSICAAGDHAARDGAWRVPLRTLIDCRRAAAGRTRLHVHRHALIRMQHEGCRVCERVCGPRCATFV